jgi:predicted flap endonuclease-1-like 5' DNA nuclease
MASIIDIEGIGESFAKKLSAAGINTVEKLLDRGCSPQGRKEIEEATGIAHSLILQWVNHADLFRIKGVGSEYSDLLEAAGVDTVPELAQRVAENLHKKLVEVNEQKKIVRQLPTTAQVADWVEQAKKLPRIIAY